MHSSTKTYDPATGAGRRLRAFRGQIDRPPASGRYVSGRRLSVHRDCDRSTGRARAKAMAEAERTFRLVAVAAGGDPDRVSRALGRRARRAPTEIETALGTLVGLYRRTA